MSFAETSLRLAASHQLYRKQNLVRSLLLSKEKLKRRLQIYDKINAATRENKEKSKRGPEPIPAQNRHLTLFIATI